jgi:hypothetical protein
MIKRLLLSAILALPWLAHADWASDRDGSAGYVEITTVAANIDEAVPFFVVYGSRMASGLHAAMDAIGDTTGRSLMASNADGSTRLSAFVIGVDTASDSFAMAIRATGMSPSTNVTYRIYAGNNSVTIPDASATYGRNAVFVGYTGVYIPAMFLVDLTGSARELAAVGSPGSVASHLETLTAATFGGSADYYLDTGTMGVTSWPITIEALAYSTSSSAAQTIAAQANSGTGIGANIATLRVRGDNGDVVTFAADGSSGSTATASTSTSYSTNTWFYATGVHDKNNDETHAYLNGGSKGTSETIVAGPSFNQFAIGVTPSSTLTHYWAGRILVVLISNVVRSDNYTSTMEEMWDGNIYTDGSWTDLGGGSGPTIADRTRGFFALN